MLPSVENPTAVQFDADVQLTLCRIAPATPAPVGVGLGTIDQAVPFQFSMSVPIGLPPPADSFSSVPTAQQSEPLTQEMSKNPPPSPAGSGGVASNVHDVPFQVSTSGA